MKKKFYKKRQSAQEKYTFITAAIFMFSMLFWWMLSSWGVFVLYLLSINITTVSLYFFDKTIAGGKTTRVPEVVLHSLAFLGGSPMAIVSQIMFHHKTRKDLFRSITKAIIFTHIAIVGVFLYF